MKVCIIWTQDIYQDAWDYVLQSQGVSRDEVYVVLLGGQPAPPMSKMTGASNLIESMDHLPPGPLVVSSPKNAKSLQGEKCLHCFEHPEDPIYVFGADNINLDRGMFGEREIDHTVYIPTEGTNIHSHVAGALVLYDRRHKEWLTK